MRTENNPIQKLANYYHLGQSIIFNAKHNFPAKRLKIIGVTGTDGKTTTTSLIYHILKESGLKVAYISTINAKMGDLELDTGLHVTTPDPWQMPKYLKMIADKGFEYVILESTSQGLEQNRLWGIEFEVATITNIKSDHLDYHENWENYAKAKFKIITQTKKQGRVVLNGDDSKAFNWINSKLKDHKREIVVYHKNDVKDLHYSNEGMRYKYQDTEFEFPLIGEYNLENSLAAINVTSQFVDLKQIAEAGKSFPTPTGRMEVIQKKPFTVIIDFAHTPHALENALKAVSTIRNKNSRIINVFGCAGKRDKARREMGKVSAELADITILTAEDPRDEKLFEINTEILEHAESVGGNLVKRFEDHEAYAETELSEVITKLATTKKPVITFDEDALVSREDAIDFAIQIAKPEDIVFITGKAHEQSLCFGEIEYPWSEHAVVEVALNKQK